MAALIALAIVGMIRLGAMLAICLAAGVLVSKNQVSNQKKG
jgi:hypothetical protein